MLLHKRVVLIGLCAVFLVLAAACRQEQTECLRRGATIVMPSVDKEPHHTAISAGISSVYEEEDVEEGPYIAFAIPSVLEAMGPELTKGRLVDQETEEWKRIRKTINLDFKNEDGSAKQWLVDTEDHFYIAEGRRARLKVPFAKPQQFSGLRTYWVIYYKDCPWVDAALVAEEE